METQPQLPKSQRHKCSACYKQYKKKEHLIEHMRVSYHSVHEPRCGVCKKHCKSLESVREHLTGPLPKGFCANKFATNGCELCLNVFDSSDMLRMHRDLCRLSAACSLARMETSCLESGSGDNPDTAVVAMDCEMVGGGSDGSLDICARVCLVDENENVIFHSYVKPIIPVTDYRYELTGITEDHLVDAMPLMEVRKKVEEILYNEELLWKARLQGGKARILVGHDLDHDLDCLQMNYPDHLIRDTARYEIQSGTHHPFEDCVAALRLYKRMRSQVHQIEDVSCSQRSNGTGCTSKNSFDLSRLNELMKMSPDDLLQISASNYRCWCLDVKANMSPLVGIS